MCWSGLKPEEVFLEACGLLLNRAPVQARAPFWPSSGLLDALGTLLLDSRAILDSK